MFVRFAVCLSYACLLNPCSTKAWDADESSPRRLCTSPNGKLIALASSDNRVRLWDAESGKLLHTLELDLPGTAVAISPDNSMLIAGTSGTRKDSAQPMRGHLWAWNIADQDAKFIWKVPVIGQTVSIAIEPNGKWFAANFVYATLGIFRLADGKLLRNWQERGNSPMDLAISPDGKTIVTAGQALILWDSTKPKIANEIVDLEKPLDADSSARLMIAKTAGSTATTVSTSGRWAIAVGAYSNVLGKPVDVVQLDMKSAKIMKFIAKDVEDVKCITLAPNDRDLLIGANHSFILKFDMDRENHPTKWMLESNIRIRAIAYFDGGKKVAVAGENGGALLILDSNTGKQLSRLWPMN